MKVKKKTMTELLAETADELPPIQVPTASGMDHIPFPTDLTVEPSRQLGTLYTNYTAYLAYVSEQLAQAKAEVRQLEVEARTAKGRAALSTRGIKIQKIAAMHADPSVTSIMARLVAAEARIFGLTSMMWTYKDYLRALEFEKERRLQEIKTEGY